MLNKADLVNDRDELVIQIRTSLNELLPQNSAGIDVPVLVISCATSEGIDTLKKVLLEALSRLPEPQCLHEIQADDKGAHEHIDAGFAVVRRRNIFTVTSDRVERLVSVTNLKSPESVHHLLQVLRAMGVIEMLIKEGAKPGCEVVLGKESFTFGEELS